MGIPLTYSTTVTQSREQPYGGDLHSLLSQPKLSPALRLAQRIHKQLGAPPCRTWLANAFLADLSSLSICTHAKLHSSSPVSRVTGSRSPVRARSPRAGKRPSPSGSVCAAASPGAPVPRLPAMATAALKCCAKQPCPEQTPACQHRDRQVSSALETPLLAPPYRKGWWQWVTRCTCGTGCYSATGPC